MSSIEFHAALGNLNPLHLQVAKEAFLSVAKSFTIRRGKVTGEEQLDERLRRAIAAYQSGTAT